MGFALLIVWAQSFHQERINVVTFIVDRPYSCCYVKPMIIEFDTVKRVKTLLECGLDFADSDKVLMVFILSLAMIVSTTARNVSLPSDFWMAG